MHYITVLVVAKAKQVCMITEGKLDSANKLFLAFVDSTETAAIYANQSLF